MVSLIKNKGTYNQRTGTYTSPTGAKYSMNLENAKKIGAVVVNPLVSGRSSSGSGSRTITTSPIVSITTQTASSSSKSKPSLLDTQRVKEILQKQEQAKLSLLTRRPTPQQYGFTRVSYGAGQTTPNFTAVPTKAFRVITTGGTITIIKNGQTRTYAGNAFIPELNMTANAFNKQIENQYKVSRGNYRFDNVLYSDLKQTEQKNRQLAFNRILSELIKVQKTDTKPTNKYLTLFLGNNKFITALSKLRDAVTNEKLKNNITKTLDKMNNYIANRALEYGNNIPEEIVLGNDYKVVRGYLNDLYTKEPNLKDKIKTFAINPYAVKTLSGFALGILENQEDFVYLPRTLTALPKIAKDKDVRREVLSSVSNSLNLAKNKILRGDLSSLAYVVGAIGIPDITDLVTDVVVKYSKKGTSKLVRLSPKFLGDLDVGDDIIVQVGNRKISRTLTDLDIKKIKLDNSLNLLDKRILDAIKSGNRIKATQLLKDYKKLDQIRLKVSKSIPKISLRKQVMLSGKEVTAISSQADQLLTSIRKKILIRKPIPNESSFNIITKNLLKKFDNGTIKVNELIQLDMLIKKQGAKGLLETSFFADPSGIIRPSRLGKESSQKIATLKDLITGNITFKRQRPQILLFMNAEIEKFPSFLKDVEIKLKKNIPLTELEQAKLLKWQLTNSGKFKPVGFLTRENEITIPAGNLIKRNKVVGKVTSKGRVINLVQTEIYNPSPSIKKALNDLQKGKLSKQQIDTLNKILYKETNINYGLSSSKLPITKPYLSVNRVAYSASSLLRKLLPNINRYSLTNYIKTNGKSITQSYKPNMIRRITSVSPKRTPSTQKYYPVKSPKTSIKSITKTTRRVLIPTYRYPMVIGMYEKLNKGFVSNLQVGTNKFKILNRRALSFNRTLNLSAYNLLNSKSKLAVIFSDMKRYPISIIKRKISIPDNYFIRKIDKLKLYYDNNKKIFYLIKK